MLVDVDKSIGVALTTAGPELDDLTTLPSEFITRTSPARIFCPAVNSINPKSGTFGALIAM